MLQHFVDKIRIGLTVLVIAHHAAQPYGPTGGNWPVTANEHSALLGPFFTVNAAFFMGLFFLISGYFVPASYDRKGAGAFMKGRLVRLGIPAILFGACVFGPISYIYNPAPFGAFVAYLYGTGWQALFAHLWFPLHLLLYSTCYYAWRKANFAHRSSPKSITTEVLLLALVSLSVSAYVIRIWFPIDKWAPLFFLIPAEIAHLPQYVLMFIFGIAAKNNNWLESMPAKMGRTCLWIGGGAAAVPVPTCRN